MAEIVPPFAPVPELPVVALTVRFVQLGNRSETSNVRDHPPRLRFLPVQDRPHHLTTKQDRFFFDCRFHVSHFLQIKEYDKQLFTAFLIAQKVNRMQFPPLLELVHFQGL